MGHIIIISLNTVIFVNSSRKTHQCVRVQEHALLELRQTPAVQLCERDAQLGTCQQRQIGRILRVQHVHLLHHIEQAGELGAHRRRDAGRDQHGQLVFGRGFLQRIANDEGAQRVRIVGGQRDPREFCGEHSVNICGLIVKRSCSIYHSDNQIQHNFGRALVRTSLDFTQFLREHMHA